MKKAQKPLTKQPAKRPAFTTVELTDPQMELLLASLESHAYWQVSEEKYRNNGYVYAPGADDPDVADDLQEIDQLSVLLGGEPITGEPEHMPEIVSAMRHCEEGEHDFDIGEGVKECNRCAAKRPFPNTRNGLLDFLQAETERMLKIARAKNQDYAGASADPFGNFARVETLGICKTEVGFLTRMTDKLCRISSFVAAGTLAVKDESVQDTLRDLANYSLLMLAYLESKKDGAL